MSPAHAFEQSCLKRLWYASPANSPACSQQPALGSAALPLHRKLHCTQLPSPQGQPRHWLRAQGTDFFLEKSILREAQDAQSCKRAEEEEGELWQSFENYSNPPLENQEENSMPLDPFRWCVRDCTLSLTCTMGFIQQTRKQRRREGRIYSGKGENHIYKNESHRHLMNH